MKKNNQLLNTNFNLYWNAMISNVVELQISIVIETQIPIAIETQISIVFEAQISIVFEIQISIVIKTQISIVIESQISIVIETQILIIIETQVSIVIETQISIVIENDLMESIGAQKKIDIVVHLLIVAWMKLTSQSVIHHIVQKELKLWNKMKLNNMDVLPVYGCKHRKYHSKVIVNW